LTIYIVCFSLRARYLLTNNKMFNEKHVLIHGNPHDLL
jgi:hypothetical protein